jgi:hypothetical protein
MEVVNGHKRLFTEKELAFIATYRGYGDGAGLPRLPVTIFPRSIAL